MPRELGASAAYVVDGEQRFRQTHEIQARADVDVGARAQIFDLLRAAAAAGATTLCASSDYEQLNAICDRVVIFGRGRVVRELSGAELSKERIAEQVYNSVAA